MALPEGWAMCLKVWRQRGCRASLMLAEGSDDGQGKTVYKLKARHARLAANAAFTLANFVLEVWSERGV
jgi:hypothetical protein